MDEAELLQNFINYLDDRDLYYDFIAFSEGKGYNPNEVEADIIHFENTHENE